MNIGLVDANYEYPPGMRMRMNIDFFCKSNQFVVDVFLAVRNKFANTKHQRSKAPCENAWDGTKPASMYSQVQHNKLKTGTSRKYDIQTSG